MAGKMPWMKFFPSDWLSDEALKRCSLAAHGLWIELLCLMHKSPRRGFLVEADGSATSQEIIARMVGCSLRQVRTLLQELMISGTASRSPEGIFFCRRMVKESGISESRSAAGSRGGNPRMKKGYMKSGFVYAMSRASDHAVKLGVSTKPKYRLYGVRRQHPLDVIELDRTWEVSNMGEAEAFLHSHFNAACIGGEWFKLSKSQTDSIGDLLMQKTDLLMEKDGKTLASGFCLLSPSEMTNPEGGPGETAPGPLDPGWLAREWLHYRRGFRANGETDSVVAETFEELIRCGVAPQTILDEIRRENRQRDEPIFEFSKRYRPKAEGKVDLFAGLRAFVAGGENGAG